MKEPIQPKPIVVVPTNTPPEIMSKLTLGGYIPVRCDDPASIKVIAPANEAVGGDIMMSALAAIASNQHLSVNSHFVANLWNRISRREKADAVEVKS